MNNQFRLIMLRILLITGFITLSLTLFAQQNVILSLKDSKTKKPIEYASVTFQKQFYLTDIYGQTKLKYVKSNENDTIYITIIGYKTIKYPLNQFLSNLELLMEETNFELKDVVVSGYKKEVLFNFIKNGILKAKKGLKPFSGQIVTLTYGENNLYPIEFLNGVYNIQNTKAGLNTTEIYLGNLTMKNENLFQNYMSIGNTKLLLSSNLLGIPNIYFHNPFTLSYKSQADVLNLDFKNLGSNKLNIKFKHPKVGGEVIYNLTSGFVESCNMEWKYYKNLPIVPLTNTVYLSDSMTIQSRQYFVDGKIFAQQLKLNYAYNSEKIQTHTYLTFHSDTLKDLPLNSLEFNNDYLDILSKPDNLIENQSLNSSLGEILSEQLSENIELEALIEGKSIDKSQIEKLTGIAYFNSNWNLNWELIPDCKTNYKESKISINLFAQKVESHYKTATYIDYLSTNYCNERNESASIYITLALLVGEKYRFELDKQLNSNANAKSSQLIYNNVVKKMNSELWRLKFETNAGNNFEEVEKWKKQLIEYSPF